MNKLIYVFEKIYNCVSFGMFFKICIKFHTLNNLIKILNHCNVNYVKIVTMLIALSFVLFLTVQYKVGGENLFKLYFTYYNFIQIELMNVFEI